MFTGLMIFCTLMPYIFTEAPSMQDVNITDLRQNLPAYVDRARRGQEIRITVRGKVVARIVPDKDEQEAARHRLKALRNSSKLGDVISPSGEAWEAERDRR